MCHGECSHEAGMRMQGIDYMHSMGMTHGDIKPDNLLLGADGQVRLCDLGSAQRCGTDDMMIRTVGTPAFFSPEMCDGRPYSARAADVWALGICLYIFVFGERRGRICPSSVIVPYAVLLAAMGYTVPIQVPAICFGNTIKSYACRN